MLVGFINKMAAITHSITVYIFIKFNGLTIVKVVELLLLKLGQRYYSNQGEPKFCVLVLIVPVFYIQCRVTSTINIFLIYKINKYLFILIKVIIYCNTNT